MLLCRGLTVVLPILVVYRYVLISGFHIWLCAPLVNIITSGPDGFASVFFIFYHRVISEVSPPPATPLCLDVCCLQCSTLIHLHTGIYVIHGYVNNRVTLPEVAKEGRRRQEVGALSY